MPIFEHEGLLTNNTIIEIFRVLKRTTESFRTVPGTALRNEPRGTLVYVPPQTIGEIETHMAELENFINADDLSHLDPLVKMALIHHQFESIHPFSDGNGRVGRIINVLYLVRAGLLDAHVDVRHKHRLRKHETVRYSQDLLNNMFRHPYTRIEFLQDDLGITRQTAARYLDQLAMAGFVEKHQFGRNNYYVNTPLVSLLMRASEN